MDPVIKEIKARLKKAGLPQMKVQRGRGTGHNWIEIRHPDFSSFDPKENEAVHGVFAEKTSCGTSLYTILRSVAMMKLGMVPKKPICESCGATYATQKMADRCGQSH